LSFETVGQGHGKTGGYQVDTTGSQHQIILDGGTDVHPGTLVGHVAGQWDILVFIRVQPEEIYAW
jgi:hypothetical protein